MMATSTTAPAMARTPRAGQATARKSTTTSSPASSASMWTSGPATFRPTRIASIPTDGGVARFYVPPDNPFVHTSLGGTWNGTYNGVNYSARWARCAPSSGPPASATPGACPSIRSPATSGAATSARTPTRRSTRSSKAATTAGSIARVRTTSTASLGTAPGGFTSIDPIYEYVHTAIAGGDAQFKGNSVVGGYVYRGTRFPVAGRQLHLQRLRLRPRLADEHRHRCHHPPHRPARRVRRHSPPRASIRSTRTCSSAAYLTGKIMRLTTGSARDRRFPDHAQRHRTVRRSHRPVARARPAALSAEPHLLERPRHQAPLVHHPGRRPAE